ncbi:MAG: right-handed parallel beta-helix repeat-containing protein, partial [Elusimicrobia bacterium]|nr:right-handed parallel beta-helix repeat-containing protein [Elusimicrobiota bacterium]
TVGGLPAGSSYYLQVSNDPSFATANIVISIATPAIANAGAPTADSAYISTFTLANGATFYWRVATVNSTFGTWSPWSQTLSFVTDLAGPTQQAASFASLNSGNAAMSESQVNNLALGVTAQITIQDSVSGLVVSTSVLAFAGDAHDNPGATGGFGVMYSTNAGSNWIDADAVTAANGGSPIVSGATSLRGFAVFNGRLYVSDGLNGKIYSSPDGNTWSASNGGSAVGTGFVWPLFVYKNKLYAADSALNGKVYATSDGASWSAVNNDAAVGDITSFAAFNGRLYAGDYGNGRIYVSSDGYSFAPTQNGAAVGVGGIASLSAFNGRLYAGDTSGRIFATTDGYRWTEAAVLPGATAIDGLTVFNGRLFGCDPSNGKVFSSANGTDWTAMTSAGGPARARSLTSFNGKLYAADSLNGNVYASFDGISWLAVNNGFPVTIGGSPIFGMIPFNGRLFVDDENGRAYQISPVTATLSGADGTAAAQTLSASGLNLVTSINAFTCGGVSPCVATNQVVFTASDLGGNASTFGPFAVRVDAVTAIAISTPSYPANGAYVNVQPNFDWIGPSTATAAPLPAGSSYYLQVSNNDPTFASAIVVSVSTPAIIRSTNAFTADGIYLSTFTLANNATYYWRVAAVNGVSHTLSPWSRSFSFVTDLAAPSMTGSFASLGSAGTLSENQMNDLTLGVTAQISVQDAASGLAVSMNALTFAGDGHEGPAPTGPFGVMYSTNTGTNWIDFSTVTTVNGDIPLAKIYAMTPGNGSLYAADDDGMVWVSADGNSWSQVNSGSTVGSPAAAGHLRTLVAWNNRLFAGDSTGHVYSSADGQSWPASSATSVGTSLTSILAFNNKLFAGDAANGWIFVSTDGNSWTAAQGGRPVGSGGIQSLGTFNGRIFAADGEGDVLVSVEGSTWTLVGAGTTFGGGQGVQTFAGHNNKLYAGNGNNGKIYVSGDGGNTWSTTNGGAAVSVTGSGILTLASFNGKLYAGDSAGRVYVSTEGSAWLTTNSGYSIGSAINSLTPFNGRLFAADPVLQNIYQLTPVAASLSGADGTNGVQTLKALSLNLATSTSPFSCAGAFPCYAHNQVIFTSADRAGNVLRAGPFAIAATAQASIRVSTPAYPANGAYMSLQPNFDWIAPATTTIAGLPAGSSFYLQVSNNDPGFTPANLVVSITTPAVVVSTTLPANSGAYISTYTLADSTTYYWRVAIATGGPWSQAFSFVTDLAAPTQSAAFASISSTGGALGESQNNGLATGVTAQVGVQDASGGLAVSVGSLVLAGDGHDGLAATGGFGVIYSTNAGQTWIDFSTITAMNGGNQIVGGASLRGMAVFKGKLYAADGALARVYSTSNGSSWGTASVGNGAIRALAVFNGRLFAADNNATGKVYSSPDGTSWTTTNNNAALGPSANIAALAVFNGRLYAGDSSAKGRVYVSTDGNSWTMTQGGTVPVQTGGVQSLAAFNGRLYAGDTSGKIYVSVDGSTWTAVNNGTPVGTSIGSLAVFNNKLYAADSAIGKLYSSPDGGVWTQLLVAGVSPAGMQALASFNGKLYASDSGGRVYVSTEGSTWLQINSGYPVSAGGSGISGLIPFSGMLYAGDNSGRVYQIAPATANLTGSDGSTAAQTLAATSLNLAASTNAAACGGIWPCGATNQVVFTASDRAGNVLKAGPFALQVAPLPAAPSGFAGAVQSETSILWSWTNNTTIVSGYRVMSGASNLSGDLPASAASWLQTSLSPNTQYGPYVARVFNGRGTADSGTVSRYTLANVPSNLTTAVRWSSATLTWSANTNPAGTIWDLQRDSGTGFTSVYTSSATLSYTDRGLTPGRTYHYQVRAENGDGLLTLFTSAVDVLTPPSPLPGGCSSGFEVKQDGSRDFTTIQSAVNALDPSLVGDACVVIRDLQTYNEQVTVQGFTNNGHQIKIMADPSFVGSAPVVAPPANSTAAFQIANASVTLQGINIVPASAIPYGVNASSAYLTISSVSVLDPGDIYAAGVAITSYTTVSYSSISVQAAHGLQSVGTGDRISNVTIQSDNSSFYALYLNGVTSSTISQASISNPLGHGAYFASASANVISASTMANAGAGLGLYSSLYLSNSSFNTMVDDHFWNAVGYGVTLDASSTHNHIVQSTFTLAGGSGKAGVYLHQAPANEITACSFDVAGGPGIRLLGSDSTAISQTTITANAPNADALTIDGSGHNTISRSYISNSVAYGLGFHNTSDLNTVSQCTILGGASGSPAAGVYLLGGTSNTIVGSAVSGSIATLISGAQNTVIGYSTLTATASDGRGLAITDLGAGLMLSSSTVVGGSLGVGIYLGGTSAGAISLSSVAITGAAFGLDIEAQAEATVLNVSSMSFASLSSGGTAIDFLGGAFVSTFNAVTFADPSIAVNVNASALGPSAITMLNYSGSQSGASHANDPLGYVYWSTSAATVALGVSAPAYPANGAYVNVQPDFDWIGPSTTTAANLPAGASFYLQVSNNDPGFGAANIIVSVTTPAVVNSTTAFTADGAYLSTFTLANNATYYWRVATTAGALGLWSQSYSFVTDFTPPAMSGSFTSLSTSAALSEAQTNDLLTGVTAQIHVQDAASGLAVSTNALAFPGDGHQGPEPTGAYGVMYSTNAGGSWIDFSTATTSNGGGPVGSRIYALTVFNGKLYAADDAGFVWMSVDGSSWSAANSTQTVGYPATVGGLRALVGFNGRLFAGDTTGRVFSSADGQSWPAGGSMLVGTGIRAMTVFNGRLYAGDANSNVYVSTSGDTWTAAQRGTAVGAGGIGALGAFNGRLFAGDGNGMLYGSVDGSSWAATNGNSFVGGNTALAAYNHALYAAGGGKIYVSSDNGSSWNGANGGGSAGLALSASPLQTLASFNGKLYAGDAAGWIYASTAGSTWMMTNNGYPVGTSIRALAPFNGSLFAGDDVTGKVYKLSPVGASLTGADGTSAAQTLSALGLNLVTSTIAIACGGTLPCLSTNQVIFTASDRAGNAFGAGPFAILVSTTPPPPSSALISTPTYPANGAYVNIQPNLGWLGPSTATLANLPLGTSYFLQVSNNDPGFLAGNIVVNVSTPAVLVSTVVPTTADGYISTFTLTDNTTYYWRLALSTPTLGPWSQTYSFVTDFSAPLLAGSAFVSLNSTGGALGEAGLNGLTSGVTVQIAVLDTVSGLAISTAALAFTGDGHDGPAAAAGYGVLYSTNSGQTWIDFSSITAANGGNPVVGGASNLRGMATFKGKLCVVDSGWGRILLSSDGNTWAASNGGSTIGGGTLRALTVFNGRLFVADNNLTGKVYSSADGLTWTTSNNNTKLGPN